MDTPNGNGKKNGWGPLIRQFIGGGLLVIFTSFLGTSLALWRDQAILAEKVVGVQTAGELGRRLLQEQIIRNDREIADVRQSSQRAHERISSHVEGHAPRPAQR